jgi:uncharacterized membrane protein YfcA
LSSTIISDPGILTAIAVAAAAGFMRGFVGVGSGMLMAPVFAIIFGPVETVGIITLMEIVVTAQLLPSVYRLIDWRLILPIGVAAAAFMPLGGWLLTSVDAELMARGIALAVLVFVVLLFSEWRYHGPRRLSATLIVGASSGTLIAATSLGNPPVILYLLAGNDNAATNRANFTGYFGITLLTLLALMLLRGLITRPVVNQAAILLPLFMLGAWIGARYFARASDRMYRRVALGLLFCVALFGLLR